MVAFAAAQRRGFALPAPGFHRTRQATVSTSCSRTERTRPRKSDGSPPQMLGMAAKDPRLVRVRPNGLDDVPEYHSDVDWEKAGTLGSHREHPPGDLAAFGSAYVNDFIQGGRVKRVYVQADAPTAMLPSDLEKLM